jgi:ribosome-associated translation inhibitor RaiA
MKLPVHIQFHDMAPSEALEAKAREYALKLDALASDIMACRVTVDLLQKHKTQGRPVGVRIDLSLPGHELVVSRVQHEDAYVALRDAFDGMKRQLQDVVRKRQGHVKQHAEKPVTVPEAASHADRDEAADLADPTGASHD